MKIIEDIFKNIEPLFTEGGKFNFAYSAFEAAESFFLTNKDVTTGKTHIRDSLDSKRLMGMVVLALIPCLIMSIYNTGLQRLLATGTQPTLPLIIGYGLWAFLPVFIVTLSVGGTWELVFSIVRKHPINEGFFVTLFLFPLILPPTIPLWQVAVAISFGVVIGKEVFGGTGMNILNPALTARAFLFFSYPASISGENIWRFVDSSKDTLVDGLTSASPLGVAASVSDGNSVIDALNSAGYTFKDLFLGTVPGSMGETSALAILIGAVILVISKIGSWRTIAGCLIGALGISSLFYFTSGESANPLFLIPPHYHLVLGGFAFGAVFMATDPVSSAATNTGKWIYGLFIGVLAITIRVVNPAYPEGMMLAILLMNVFAPVIDHFVAMANIKRRLARGKK